MENLTKTQQVGSRLVTKFGDSQDAAVWVERLKGYATGTRQVYLYSLYDYYKSQGKEIPGLKEQSVTLKAGLLTEAKKQEKTPKQKENWLEWKDVLRVRVELKKEQDTYGQHLHYLILCLYTMIPPLRLDWATGIIHNTEAPVPAEGNVLDLKNNCFHLRNYKTARTHGALTLPIPEDLQIVLKDSLTRFPRKAVLGQARNMDLPINAANLSQHLLNIFQKKAGRRISVQILRRSFVSHQMAGEPSLAEQERRATALGHTFAVHQLYRKL